MSSQPTQSSMSNQSGNVSDATEVQTRRSSRVTTPMKRSGMIQPSPDSCRTITQPLLSERTSIGTSSQPKKRTNAPSESDSTPHATPVQSQQTRKKVPKKPKKTGPAAATSESNTTAKDVDLAQDSDEENSKVKKRQRKNPEEDDVKVFFLEPFRRKDDKSGFQRLVFRIFVCTVMVLVKVEGSRMDVQIVPKLLPLEQNFHLPPLKKKKKEEEWKWRPNDSFCQSGKVRQYYLKPNHSFVALTCNALQTKMGGNQGQKGVFGIARGNALSLKSSQ
ncbi:hypothetical protein PGT21_020600 [Puccinia graminis f. sp. tritici]|uniref:Uncharacterized protein n=1 Tax=Puccinia graminis f. sp. tritici TaxID=56615 RepID=A0A5B0NUX2_PUCGR|nr:hypothetical protein PGT21_020600 [Puccinia graminis f. sp. tritici]